MSLDLELMTLICLHGHLLRDQVELHCFLQDGLALCTLRILRDYLLDGIVELNLLEDFSLAYGPVTAEFLALRKLAYKRCETSQPCPGVLSLIVSHEFEYALLVGLSANPSVIIVILVAVSKQSAYGKHQKYNLDSEGHAKDDHAALEIIIFLGGAFKLQLLLLLIEGHLIEKESAKGPNSDDKRYKVSEKDREVLRELTGSAPSSQQDVLEGPVGQKVSQEG